MANGMTKELALEAMEDGHRVYHRHFTSKEWMTMKNGNIQFEDGCSCTVERFFETRKTPDWDDGYGIRVSAGA